MDTSRIAELLQPFLAVPCSVGGGPLKPDLGVGGEVRGSQAGGGSSTAEAESGETYRGVLRQRQLQYISMYIDILLRWNVRINLTAIRHPEDIVTRHFGESLFAARHLFPADAAGAAQPAAGASAELPTPAPPLVFDIGSGAGFPGLPIKIWAPEIELRLIESNQKKATFLREVVRSLGLTGVNVFAGRAEDLSGGGSGANPQGADHSSSRILSQPERADAPSENRPGADAVTLRAVEQFETILPVAASLARPGGRIALLIGETQADRGRELAGQFHWQDPIPVPCSQERVLLVGRAESK